MIQLRLLGGLDLVDPGGRGKLRSLLVQPKRLALLVYLALAGDHRFRRRDTVVGLFWPEFDAEHARGALRQALRFLRWELGAHALTSRGEEEVGVNREVAQCDAATFEGACESGDWKGALATYRGDLLTGVHIADITSGSIVRDIAEGVAKGRITADESSEEKTAAEVGNKAALVAFARQCFERADAAVKRIGDAELAAMVPTPWNASWPGYVAFHVLHDEFLHHRGQLYAFARCCGAEPPFMWGYADNALEYQPRGRGGWGLGRSVRQARAGDESWNLRPSCWTLPPFNSLECRSLPPLEYQPIPRRAYPSVRKSELRYTAAQRSILTGESYTRVE